MKREGVRVEVRLRSRFPKLAIPPPLLKLAAIQVRKENGEKEKSKRRNKKATAEDENTTECVCIYK